MTSGYPVSTYATNDAGYRMELNGVEQKHFYTNGLEPGYAYYGGVVLPELPEYYPDFDISCFVVIFTPSTGVYSLCLSYGVGAFSGFSDKATLTSYFYFAGSGPHLTFEFNPSVNSDWVFLREFTENCAFGRADRVVFSSVDYVIQSQTYSFGSYVPYCAYDSSFLSADYSNFSAVDRTLSLTGTPVTGEISGDQTYSFTASNPYIDVELPLSAWVDDVPAAEDYWSFSIDGTLAFDLAVGLQSAVAGQDKSYYALSDLVPSSWQLICNGALMEDSRCTGSFDSVASSADGYKAALTISTGALNLGTLNSGEQGITLETLGFRIYLTSASGGAPTTITNSNTFESITPYAYINFNDADGNSGLPALTFYENYASGDLSNGDPGDYSVSVNDFAFDFGYIIDAAAPSGSAFYGGVLFPAVPVQSGFSYVTIYDPGGLAWCFLSKSQPYWNGSAVVFGSSFGSDWLVYSLNTDSNTWAAWTFSEVGVKTTLLTYHNYSFEGNSAMSPSSSGPSETSMTLTAGGALDNLAPNAGYVSGLGTPISYASAGNSGTAYMFGNNSGEGYIDVTYPAEVFGVLSTEEFLSLAVEGNLALRARVFPAVTDSTGKQFGAPYYIDNPYSVQLIFNDVVFSEEYPLNYITDDDSVASVSGLALNFDNFTQLDTVTFRLKFQYDSESTEWMGMEDIFAGGDSFTIGADLDILTSPVFDPEYPPGPVVLPTVTTNMAISGDYLYGEFPVKTVAPDGYYFYNGLLLPQVVLPDGYLNYVIIDDGTSVVAYTDTPTWDGSRITPAGRWGLWSSSAGKFIWADEDAAGSTAYVTDLDAVTYSSFDIRDVDANLEVGRGYVSHQGLVFTYSDFDPALMTNVEMSGREFLVTGYDSYIDMSGGYILGHGSGGWYIDVNIPLTQFPVLGSITSFDSLALSGDLSLDVSVGLISRGLGSTLYYNYSDLVPSSFQVLYNGTLIEGYDQTYTIKNPARTDSGFKRSLSLGTGCFDEVSLSTNMLTAKGLSTVGFRIYLSCADGSCGESIIDNSKDLQHFQPYAYVNFSTADGGNGLPTLVLTSNSTGGNFDDSNLVEWLEKIHTELTTYLPEFSRHFQSMFEEMSAQTDILNEMLVALKDNSAVESVSSTVTNIYNSISNVETSISNVESTINNVSNTVANMEQSQQAMQQTQEEMKETQEEMEEDTSALRDVYASEDDIVLKEGTSEFSSAVTDVLIGSSEDGSSGLLGSDSGNDVKSLKKLGNRLKEWFSFDADIGELFDIVESGSDWYSQETANGIDCTVSVTTYGRYNDPYSMSDYYEYIDFLFEKYGGDEE